MEVCNQLAYFMPWFSRRMFDWWYQYGTGGNVIGQGSAYSVSMFCDLIILVNVWFMIVNMEIFIGHEACIQLAYFVMSFFFWSLFEL